MIFYWLRLAYLRLVWLFTPPTARDVARVNPDAPCPACGASDGELACVFGSNVDGQPDKVLVRHMCHTCGACWHEKPVMNVTINEVWGVGKTEINKSLSRSGRAA